MKKLLATGRNLGVLRHLCSRYACTATNAPFSAAPTPIHRAPSPAEPLSDHGGSAITSQASCPLTHPQTAATIENP